MGMYGFLVFLGYLLIAPVVTHGDTGKVFSYLKIPLALSIFIAFISVIAIFILLSKLSRELRFYTAGRNCHRNENCRQLLIYPIFASIILVVLLNLPITNYISLLPTLFMPLSFFVMIGGYKRMTIRNTQLIIDRISIPLAIISIFSIAIFRYLV